MNQEIREGSYGTSLNQCPTNTLASSFMANGKSALMRIQILEYINQH
jgi:hypothetical protein